ncbi:MAG: DUF1819 family protein [Lewinellaceae bacterium]|nr:DUF1819 family protein [Lewinellaceae bacterium]
MKYRLSFTGASLMLNESLKIAEAYHQLGNWDAVRQQALKDNVLQKGKEATIKREFRELKKRLEKLTGQQLEMLIETGPAGQRLLLFLGVCKLYPFVGDFVLEVLRNKVVTFEHIILESDYSRFFQMKEALHPELESISDSTRKKLRSRLFRMLGEAGLINNTKEKWITPPIVTRCLAEPLLEEDPALLKFWLVSDKDIKRLIKHHEENASE